MKTGFVSRFSLVTLDQLQPDGTGQHLERLRFEPGDDGCHVISIQVQHRKVLFQLEECHDPSSPVARARDVSGASILSITGASTAAVSNEACETLSAGSRRSPQRCADTTACNRLDTPSSLMMQPMWIFTVPVEIFSRRQISLLGSPSHSSESTSRCRGVRCTGGPLRRSSPPNRGRDSLIQASVAR